MTDLYKVLQVDPAADTEVVEAAYRRLARKFHPDVSPHPDADSRIRDLNAAYEVLGDPHRRAAYDTARAHPLSRRTRVRVVRPRRGGGAACATPPRAGGWAVAPGGRRRPSRPILAATMAGLASTVAIAAFSAQLFSAAIAEPHAAPTAAVVLVTSQSEPPPVYEPPPRQATPTPAHWPPPMYTTETAASPAVDLFSKFVGAARQATRRLQGPVPPEPPYNPIAP